MTKVDTDAVGASNLLNAVAQVVRDLRVQQGLSQRMMSQLSNLNRSYLSDLENGKVNPSIGNLGRIASALKLSASQLLIEAERIIANGLALAPQGELELSDSQSASQQPPLGT